MVKLNHSAHHLLFFLLALCACGRGQDIENVKDTQKAEEVAETVRQKARGSEKAEGSQDLVKDKVSVTRPLKASP